MQRIRHEECVTARSLERVGEWWSILILRTAQQRALASMGSRKALDNALNMLARRLRGLADSGILERRRYGETLERFEYVLTPLDQDFRPVLLPRSFGAVSA